MKLRPSKTASADDWMSGRRDSDDTLGGDRGRGDGGGEEGTRRWPVLLLLRLQRDIPAGDQVAEACGLEPSPWPHLWRLSLAGQDRGRNDCPPGRAQDSETALQLSVL